MKNLRFILPIAFFLFAASISYAQVATMFLYGHGKQVAAENEINAGVSEIDDTVTELKNNKPYSQVVYRRTYFKDKLVDIGSSFQDSLSLSRHEPGGYDEGQHIAYYYETRTIQKIENFKEGRNIGDYMEFYIDGKIKTKGQYHSFSENEVLPNDTSQHSVKDSITGKVNSYMVLTIKSIKTGTWFYYNADGKPLKEEVYDNGKLLRTIIID